MQRGKDLNGAVQAFFFREGGCEGGERGGKGRGGGALDLCGSSLRLGVSGLSGLRVWMLIKKISSDPQTPLYGLLGSLLWVKLTSISSTQTPSEKRRPPWPKRQMPSNQLLKELGIEQLYSRKERLLRGTLPKKLHSCTPRCAFVRTTFCRPGIWSCLTSTTCRSCHDPSHTLMSALHAGRKRQITQLKAQNPVGTPLSRNLPLLWALGTWTQLCFVPLRFAFHHVSEPPQRLPQIEREGLAQGSGI